MSAVTGSILVESGSLRGQRFLLPLPPSSLVLGRDASCSICFPSEAEADRLMGRRHAQIDVRSDGVFVLDLNSANGTLVQLTDGRIQPLTGELPLQNGMRIALGGGDGTWLGVQIVADSATDATHSHAPQQTVEQMTVRLCNVPTPPLPRATVKHPVQLPSVPPSSAAAEHITPAVAAASRAQPERDRPDFARDHSEAQRAQIDAVPVVQDQEMRRHRMLLLRQIAAILVIVLLGCLLGVALGTRAPQEDAVTAP